jgi:hypothetical protein
MGKRVLLLMAVVILAMVILPATAFAADLVNEYGMHFAGQQTCVDCHAFFGSTVTDTTHSRMAKLGLIPDPPGAWTVFQSSPGVGEAFSIADNTWITLGDYAGGLATEYLYWEGSTDPTVMPWNLVEGLSYETDKGEWVLAPDGLEGLAYSCQRCHMLGTTAPAKNGEAVPNPAATIQPTATTATQWAREDGTSVGDFMTDPTVSYAGLGIQCEQCHGTGVAATAEEGGHTNTGVKVITDLETLGQSQVCGQCHGSYTNVPGTLGIYGYTPNLPMRDFVDVNGLDRNGVSYTYIPTADEFMAAPANYYMFPNGSNAKGNHYYYDEWSASAHSYRAALANDSPDATVFQNNYTGHFGPASGRPSGCWNCHTGEGYLKSKNAEIAATFTPTADNVGFMGQECVTCHIPHPWKQTADGVVHDTIRQPDKAGERSETGQPFDNQSICEDCHNWQMEVLGSSPTYAPVTNLATAHVISHPQRETFHARNVMVDVPAGSDFMPGAECEDCHMPKTNKNANRFSHGMKIMMPGGLYDPEDPEKSPQGAVEWMTAAGSSYQGQDSCTTCHPPKRGQSLTDKREDLQKTIDAWQAKTAGLAADAEAAITAVTDNEPDSFFDASNSSDPTYILIGRATWNYKAWEADSSDGVHNPPYIDAGLVKATQMAKSAGGKFAQLFSSNSVAPGGTGFITGQVKNGDGTAAAAASLKLSDGSTTTSDAKGNFSFMVKPNGSTTYTVTWIRSGDSGTWLTASAKVAVAKRSSKTTIAASATTITFRKSVRLSGKVSPNAAGQTVKIQYRRTTSQSWKNLKTRTLNASSGYAYKYTPPKRGTWYFRTLYAGTSTVAASHAHTIRVTVR